MTIFLDHQQRLNLTAMMDAQKGSLGEVRAFWKMHDRIELTEAEKVAINYRVIVQNGIEYPGWDRDKKLDPRAFDFNEAEEHRLRRMVEEWSSFTGMDRMWLETVLEQLSIPEPSVSHQ